MDAKEIKKGRKNLKIFEVAATDKENLTQKLNPKKKPVSNNSMKLKLAKKSVNVIEHENSCIVDIKNEINTIKNLIPQKKNDIQVITAEDLTSDTPSEKYWEHMAESRRVALESALKENVDLNMKLSEMEYENNKLKEMLKEAQTLVEVLTEMLEGSNSDAEHEGNEKSTANHDGCKYSEGEVGNDSDSFQS